MAALLMTVTAGAANSPTEVPAEFIENRVYVVASAADGQIVRFFTDTGGGWNAISAEIAEKMGLAVIDTLTIEQQEHPVVAFPEFTPPIPEPSDHFLGGKLIVADAARLGHDGFLGGRWHADRIWEFDYPGQTLRRLEREHLPDGPEDQIPLGFQVTTEGNRTMHFPRMAISVAGKPLQMLLDTGATATLAEDAAEHFRKDPGTRVGTSFIAKSVFDEWVSAHPEWTVLPRGDAIQGNIAPMIEVPEITIGPHTVGPVWFAMRPDPAFRRWMSGMMDQPIDGAIGGSAFQYFRMIIDYPEATAYFITSPTSQSESQSPAALP